MATREEIVARVAEARDRVAAIKREYWAAETSLIEAKLELEKFIEQERLERLEEEAKQCE
jgi:hypothetical protein